MEIKFSYDESLLALIRSVPGRKYNPGDRSWTVPDTQLTVEILRGTPLEQPDIISARQHNDIPYSYVRKPYSHQKRITQHLLTDRCAVFAETGTGKTQCVVDAIGHHGGKSLIVCPAPLVGVWQDEFPGLIAAHGKNRVYEPICVTSYDTLARDVLAGKAPLEWDYLYFDESQLIKNHTTKRHKAAVKLKGQKFILTGTPYGNSWKDVWCQLRVVFPEIGTMTHFYEYFCEFDEWGGVKKYKNIPVLQRIIERCAIAVRKADCLDLPPKTYQVVKLAMSDDQKRLYKRAVAGGIGDKAIQNVLERVNVLRQLSSGFSYDLGQTVTNPKTEYLESISWDVPTIIWVNYVAERRVICDVLAGLKISFCVADGENPAKPAVDAFNEGRADVLVANLQSVQYGFTCNRAGRVIYYSPSFSQLQRSQSEDRCHRIGQTKNVLYVDLICSPIEEYMRKSLQKHLTVKDAIMADLAKNCLDFYKAKV